MNQEASANWCHFWQMDLSICMIKAATLICYQKHGQNGHAGSWSQSVYHRGNHADWQSSVKGGNLRGDLWHLNAGWTCSVAHWASVTANGYSFTSVKERGIKLDILALMRTNVGTAAALCMTREEVEAGGGATGWETRSPSSARFQTRTVRRKGVSVRVRNGLCASYLINSICHWPCFKPQCLENTEACLCASTVAGSLPQ